MAFRVKNVLQPGSDIAVIMTAPADAELTSMQAFTGMEGRFVRRCLALAGVPQIYSMLYLCQEGESEPLANFNRNHAIPPTWTNYGADCVTELMETIATINPRLIFTVGDLPTFAVTKRWNINNYRGSILTFAHDTANEAGVHICPLLPFSFISMNNSCYRHVNVADIKKAVDFVMAGGMYAPREITVKPKFDICMDMLEYLYQAGLEGHSISFDIETKYNEINCISFSLNGKQAISIPFTYEQGFYFTLAQEVAVMKAIGDILCNKNIRKCGQNLAFDSHMMLRNFGMRVRNIDDTMVAQHAIYHELPKGLDIINSLYTDMPYYKAEGKEWFKKGGAYERLWVYNAQDSIVCAEAFPKQIKLLEQINNIPAYERQRSIIEPCVYMMEHGIKVDMEGLRTERARLQHAIEMDSEELNRLAPGLNPQSPKQLADYFYTKKRCKPHYNKAGKIACDKLAMKKLTRAGVEEAAIISRIKKNQKLVSTYLLDSKIDTDGRLRCFYKPCGTAYSRLASSESLFGTGMNMQNWPHDMMRFLIPDPGYVYYGFDLSQAENRIVAYVGNIDQMISAFEQNQDVHKLTASLIFRKPVDEISDEPGSSSIGGGEHSERDWGKRANHGLNYDLGYRAFGMLYEIPDAEAKRIVEGYHVAYPGVRKGFHSHVRNSLNKNRCVENLMGRRTMFLSDMGDSVYKAAYSCIPQGTVGDVINERGMAHVYYDPYYKPLELLIQVHDSIGFQLPVSMPWAAQAMMLQRIKDSLEIPLKTHYGREFVIPADLAMSLTLRKEDGCEIKAKKWPANITDLASSLESNYNKLREQQNVRA